MYKIGDFLIQIKNAYMAKKKQITYPFSKVCLSIGNILVKEGYLKKIVEQEKDGKKVLVVDLMYHGKEPAIDELKLISKPSVHNYVSHTKVKRTLHQHGVSIVSTSKGIMTNKQAVKEGHGGELLFSIS